MSTVRELARSRDLMANLTLRDVRSRYKRTVLGNLWSLINPLALMAIYTLVFGFFLRVEPDVGRPSGLDVFALWLLCGLLPWNFMSTGVSAGLASLLANANLVHRVYLPRAALVVSAVGGIAFTFLIEMGVLSVVLLLFGSHLLIWLPLVMIALVLLMAFTLGLALMLSIANVYFRDTQHFVAIFLQLWFYLTPILYPVSYVASQEDRLAANGHDIPLVAILKLNPMEHFATVFRNLLYDNRFPSLVDIGVCVSSAVVALWLGLAVFGRFQGRLAEEL